MSKPCRKGSKWCIKLVGGYEIEFASYEEAWEFYDEHNE